MGVDKRVFEGVSLLYAEDEAGVREAAVMFLENYFSELYVARDGREALELYRKHNPMLLILDIQMPFFNGIEVARQIRMHNETVPILFTTAHSERDILLESMPLKLDEYVLKPFSPIDLIRILATSAAGLEANLHRLHPVAPDCRYDFAQKKIIWDQGESFLLGRHESDLLELLIEHEGSLVPFSVIEKRVYRNDVMSPEALKSLIKKLRKKLPEKSITNTLATGYRLN